MKTIFPIILFIFFSDIALAKEQVLIGGIEAKPGDFPEVVYISSGRSRCSATIVGPNVILTAAHCTQDGGTIRPASKKKKAPMYAEFMLNQQVFQAVCHHHPDYKSKYSYDFALCKTRERMDVKYAFIAEKAPTIGENINLLGFGCVNPRDNQGGGGNGGNDGKLRYGTAKVTQVDNGTNGTGGGQYFFTIDSTALCFGDSGGPSMELIKDPKNERHFVNGVNSRGDIRRRSLLSSTFMMGFQAWAKAWALTYKTKICGIHENCSVIDEPDPDPKPDPKPDPDRDKCIEERYKVWKYNKLLNEWEKKLDHCMKKS